MAIDDAMGPRQLALVIIWGKTAYGIKIKIEGGQHL